jgi:mono/diheme cytochrome c family protein
MRPSPTAHQGGIALVATILLGAACQPAAKPAQDPVARGRYLVTGGVCDDCHTPKVFTAAGMSLDSTRRLSGHRATDPVPAMPAGGLGQWGAFGNPDFTAWVGPWGTSFTANLTPHETGLAGWTSEMFIKTIRDGKHAGVGRPLLPPMPWPMYSQLSDEDLSAIFAYLQTLPPVDNRVPQPIPPPAASQSTGTQ